MENATRHYFAGALWGAGLALFVLYVLSQAVAIALDGWPRIAVGALGLVLFAAGFVCRPRPTKPAVRSDAEPDTAPDRGRK
jgi:hypothetical protein